MTFTFLEALLFYRSLKFHSHYDAETNLRFVIARIKGHFELMKFIPDAPSYLNSLGWLHDELNEHPGLYGVIVREEDKEVINTFYSDFSLNSVDMSKCEDGNVTRGMIYFLCRSVELFPGRSFFFLVAIDITDQFKNFYHSVVVGSIAALLSFLLFHISWLQVKRLIGKQEELERRLLASEKLALAGKLAAMISHEIRNPLNALSMAVQYVQATGEISREVLDIIRDETERLKELSNELFGMQSDFVSGMEVFSIHPMVMELEARFSPKASSLGINFCCQYPPEDVNVRGNKKWLSRALENLLRNAFEAVPPSNGRVKFQAEVSGETLVFTVEDNGSGILEGEKAMIFEPFYTTRKEGLGLGLYIVQKVAEAHGGTVSVESSKEGGTVFFLKIPIGVREDASRKI
ncbi:MAG: HAMP domain-containing histidine kinase [Syntrophobacterales bacterium]|nr:HAMP domain-containing histidine kinase [Syntrophobacterales bacterium]